MENGMAEIEKIFKRGQTKGQNFAAANQKFAEQDGIISGVEQDISDVEQAIENVAENAGKINKIAFGGEEAPIEQKIAKVSVSSDIKVTKSADNKTLTLSVPELPNKATSVELSINETTYELTATLKRADGASISTSTVDLPIEEMVSSAYYDKTNKQIVLVLKSGATKTISLAEIISGIVSANGKLSAGDVILGNGASSIKNGGSSFVSTISGSNNIPTDNAVNKAVARKMQKWQWGQTFSTTSAADGHYVANFSEENTILRPLMVTDRNGKELLVDWSLNKDDESWLLISKTEILSGAAYFMSFPGYTGGGGSPFPPGGGDIPEVPFVPVVPEFEYRNDDLYIYYTPDEFESNYEEFFDKDTFCRTETGGEPIREEEIETEDGEIINVALYRDPDKLYIQLFAWEQTDGAYPGDTVDAKPGDFPRYHFTLSTNPYIDDDGDTRRRDIELPFGSSTWQSLVGYTSGSDERVIVPVREEDRGVYYHIRMAIYHDLSPNGTELGTNEIIVLQCAGDSYGNEILIIGGRNSGDEFVPLSRYPDANFTPIPNGVAYEAIAEKIYKEEHFGYVELV